MAPLAPVSGSLARGSRNATARCAAARFLHCSARQSSFGRVCQLCAGLVEHRASHWRARHLFTGLLGCLRDRRARHLFADLLNRWEDGGACHLARGLVTYTWQLDRHGWPDCNRQ